MIKTLIEQSIVNGNPDAIKQSFDRLYSIPYFQHTLNYTILLMKKKRLVFEVRQRTFMEQNDGVCVTSIKKDSTKVYLIQIVKNEPNTMIHELSHAIEKDLTLDLSGNFLNAIRKDMSEMEQNGSFLINLLIKKVLIDEVQSYDTKSKISEFFARIYDILARTQDLDPVNYNLKLKDIAKCFANSLDWIEKNVNKKLESLYINKIPEYKKSLPTNKTHTDRKWADRIPVINSKK